MTGSMEGEQREPAARDRGHDVRMVLIGVAAVLLLWFALGNLESVSIHFWIFHTRKPVILVIAISGLLGAALALLLTRQRRRKAGTGEDGS